MGENKKSITDYLNDEHFRANAESAMVGIFAFIIILVSKGAISGFSLDLFFTLEPYASGLAVAIASSLILNNMIDRGTYDEIDDNDSIKKELGEIDVLDKQITDYDYVEYFLDNYNTNEYKRLQKIQTEKETRKLKYLISVKKSLGKKATKLQKRLEYLIENGATVKAYKQVGIQDLLSFQSDNELKGSEKINFSPIKSQKKKLARNKLITFLSSGLIAGVPIAFGGDRTGLISFIAIFMLMLLFNAFRTYTNTRRVTRTTYYKSLQYKKNVLILCLENFKHWTPKQTVKEEVIEKPILIEGGSVPDILENTKEVTNES